MNSDKRFIATDDSFQLASAITDVYRQSRKLKWNTLRRRLKAIEERFVSRMGTSHPLVTEVRRRVAESLLEVALENKRSSRLWKLLFSNLRRVGFTNIHIQTEKTLIYVKACVRANFIDQAFNTMLAFVQDLGTEKSRYRKLAMALAKKEIERIQTFRSAPESRGR